VLTVVELNQTEQLYKKYGSIKQVSRELGVSRNTVRKYLRNIDAVQEGNLLEIYPEKREINRPKSVVNDELIQLVQ
jgi:transposase-like protein